MGGGAWAINSTNELIIDLPLENDGYDFGSKKITITVDVVEYDAKTTSTITLADLNGTYNSGEAYNTLTIKFS